MVLSAAVRARFEAPGHAGLPTGGVLGEAGRVDQGVRLRLGLRVLDGRITEAGFLAFGCPSAVAAADWLCEWLSGRTLEEAASIRGLAIAEALALPADKLSVALLTEDALGAALAGAADNRQE